MQIQTYYNLKHSQTRISVEQAFGKLKSRFRCLINPIITSLEIAILIIITSCILHNICEERQENILDDNEYFEDQNRFQTLSNNNTTNEVTNSVRDNLANYLWNQKILRDNRRSRYNIIFDSEDEGDDEISE